MEYNVTQVQGNPVRNSVELVVEDVDSSTIAVRAGDFTIASQTYTVPEDQVYAMVDAPEVDVFVRGHLVEETASGDVLLLVDEIFEDGEDTKYVFAGSPHRLIHSLFSFTISAGATDHDGIEADVTKIVATPEPPEGEEG